jgi:hypothetical protein
VVVKGNGDIFILNMKDTRFILTEDVQDAINEFYDYSYLLNEGRQLNEFNIKDAAKKANDLITFAVKKTGNAVNDNALKIYVAATNKLQSSIAKIKANEKDKKRGLMFTVVSKIISFFVKNPKLAFASVRVGLTVLTMIGSAIAGYEASNNTDAFDGIFEKLGIDMDASSVGDADDLADQMDKLDHLTKMNDEELGKNLNQAVADMGIDVNKPDDQLFFQKGGKTGGDELAPTDLMNDPAYADYQAAIEKIRMEKGDDTVRRLINLAKLDRVLDEQHFKGMNVDARVVYKTSDIRNITDVLGTDGEVVGKVKLDSSNNLMVSDFEMKHNGVTISKMKQVYYRVGEGADGYSITKTQLTGVTSDIHTRVRQLTSGVDNDTVDQLMNGMKKFSNYGKTNVDLWPRQKNESYKRMMVLAGIINEEGMLQRGVAAVKKFVTNAKNAAQNFLTGLTNKLTQFGSSIGAIFATPENMNKLKDGREHTFVVKNGKIEII